MLGYACRTGSYTKPDVPYWRGTLVTFVLGLVAVLVSLNAPFVDESMIAVAAVAAILLVRKNEWHCDSSEAKRVATKERSPVTPDRSIAVAVILAAIMVILSNEPIIAMYIEQVVAWCRKRF
ncbi:hypothetical protein DWU98_09655 [Dyella monticola]|uniref:Uncharacterized protein n=2 Tax=Dyella monticola TaxID=1927958 RepID=A0A370X205_9GAMM|nr:hypothetical protein DWU98_09655 [Dyella monticola]